MKEKSIFATLSEINCNDKTEKKNGLTYLSWSWAWGIVKQHYPSANYHVHHFDGKPYLFDEYLGYMVMTTVTIDGESIPMQLPVMDGANKAQKNVKYTYEVKEYKDRSWTGKYIEKPVEPATMFDINTSIMRCLTKNLAMFGLGHYIYAGEDLPEESEESKAERVAKEKERAAKEREQTDKLLEEALKVVSEIGSRADFEMVWKTYSDLHSNSSFTSAMRKKAVTYPKQ